MKGGDVVVDGVGSCVGVSERLRGLVDEPVVSFAQAAAARDLLVPQVLEASEVSLDLLRAEAGAAGAEEVGVALVRALGVASVPRVAGIEDR